MKTYTEAEIVAILHAAERDAEQRLNYGVQDDLEHIGWRTALVHLAKAFGVIREYVDTPPAEAEKSA